MRKKIPQKRSNWSVFGLIDLSVGISNIFFFSLLINVPEVPKVESLFYSTAYNILLSNIHIFNQISNSVFFCHSIFVMILGWRFFFSLTYNHNQSSIFHILCWTYYTNYVLDDLFMNEKIYETVFAIFS